MRCNRVSFIASITSLLFLAAAIFVCGCRQERVGDGQAFGDGSSPSAIEAIESQSSQPWAINLNPQDDGDQQSHVLWLRDPVSDLALGVNTGKHKDSTFGTRIHEFNTYPREYSCFPDDYIWFTDGDSAKLAYAGYLRWSSHVAPIDADANRGYRVTYKFEPERGWLTRYIEKSILNQMDLPPFQMQVVNTLERGRPWLVTEIVLKNTTSRKLSARWVHQDAIVLDLRRQDQKDVDIISSFDEKGYVAKVDIEQSPDDPVWVGVRNPVHHYGVAYYSPQANAFFSLRHYLNLRGRPCQAVDPSGMECPLAGNDRFLVRDKIDPLTHLAKVKRMPQSECANCLKVSGFVLDLGVIDPGHEIRRTFYRIPIKSAKNSEEFRKEVAASLKRLH